MGYLLVSGLTCLTYFLAWYIKPQRSTAEVSPLYKKSLCLEENDVIKKSEELARDERSLNYALKSKQPLENQLLEQDYSEASERIQYRIAQEPELKRHSERLFIEECLRQM